MEARQHHEPHLVALPGNGSAQPGPASAPVVWIDGERLVVEHLALVDPTLTAFVAERAEADRRLAVAVRSELDHRSVAYAGSAEPAALP